MQLCFQVKERWIVTPRSSEEGQEVLSLSLFLLFSPFLPICLGLCFSLPLCLSPNSVPLTASIVVCPSCLIMPVEGHESSRAVAGFERPEKVWEREIIRVYRMAVRNLLALCGTHGFQLFLCALSAWWTWASSAPASGEEDLRAWLATELLS